MNISDLIANTRQNFELDQNGEFAREIAFLCKLGFRIDAIKKVRTATSLGLKEAKDFVDAFEEDVQYISLLSEGENFQRHFNSGMEKHRDRLLIRARQDIDDLRHDLLEVTKQRDIYRQEMERLRRLVTRDAA